MDPQTCEHNWSKVGNWDGWDGTGEKTRNTGGPVVECLKCSTRKNVTREEWEELSKS